MFDATDSLVWSNVDVRFGSKADICPQKVMSALPSIADMCGAIRHVRYGPNADIRNTTFLNMEEGRRSSGLPYF
jgi:hypothetical protein